MRFEVLGKPQNLLEEIALDAVRSIWCEIKLSRAISKCNDDENIHYIAERSKVTWKFGVNC